jgi:MFS family permease
MIIRKRVQAVREVYEEYPRQFWILVMATFIDRLGGALMFPFFTLYITQKFQVGMTQVGVIFGLFSITSVVGSVIGGALTDRIGRKGMLLFGLVVSSVTSILMGVINAIDVFFVVTLAVGLFANVGGPAQGAMVADLLPEEKRAQGYGVLRIVANLAVTIGPLIGGLMVAQSYLLLFISDAVASLITAVIVYVALQETRPVKAEGTAGETVGQTFGGYITVIRDLTFTWFLGASVLMALVYMQMNTTLAVYLRDTHGIPAQGFGYILSLNAGMVVLFQFPIMGWVKNYRPVVVMAAGTLLYAIGFGMYGFVSTFSLFLLAMVVITIGEMLVSPVAQAIVAALAPEDMRGRYLAVYGFSWVIPTAVGPLLAGILMDRSDPRWVWYAAGLLGLAAAGAFYLMELWVRRANLELILDRLKILEMVEERAISVKEAASRLEAIRVGSWIALADQKSIGDKRHLRIQISDLASGLVKTDMRLPMGLVHTALTMGSQLAADLDHLDQEVLAQLIRRTTGEQGFTLDMDGDERVEISLD